MQKEIVLPEWIEPIIDRTQDDVNTLLVYKTLGYFNLTDEQKLNWAKDLKGAINYSDLYRIGIDIGWLNYLIDNGTKYKSRILPETTLFPNLELLPRYDYILKYDSLSDLAYVYDPPKEIPTQIYYTKLLDAVSVIYNAGYRYVSTPNVPKQPLNTFEKWNNIEQILKDCFEIYNKEEI